MSFFHQPTEVMNSDWSLLSCNVRKIVCLILGVYADLNMDVVACRVMYATTGMKSVSETRRARGMVLWPSKRASSLATNSSMSLVRPSTISLVEVVYSTSWLK